LNCRITEERKFVEEMKCMPYIRYTASVGRRSFCWEGNYTKM
jgi:hypothetical protein